GHHPSPARRTPAGAAGTEYRSARSRRDRAPHAKRCHERRPSASPRAAGPPRSPPSPPVPGSPGSHGPCPSRALRRANGVYENPTRFDLLLDVHLESVERQNRLARYVSAAHADAAGFLLALADHEHVGNFLRLRGAHAVVERLVARVDLGAHTRRTQSLDEPARVGGLMIADGQAPRSAAARGRAG